jgi:hypothetical protein
VTGRAGRGRGDASGRTSLRARRGRARRAPWNPHGRPLREFTDGDGAPSPKPYDKSLFTVTDNGSPWNMIRYFGDHSHGPLTSSS